jgi:hypothetical protein
VTDSDVGTGTETEFGSPIELESLPVATLGPVLPPGVNLAGTGVLTPAPIAELWYNGSQAQGDDVPSEPVRVRLNITYIHPIVNLDYSIFLRDVRCDSDGVLHGRFNESYSYFFAKSSWPLAADFVLVTSAPSCGADEAQNAFFLAQTVMFQDASLSFEAHGQEVELVKVIEEMGIEFGNLTITSNGPKDEEHTCGAPPSDIIQGLPAIPCGTGFDLALDSKLGYYSSQRSDAQVQIHLRRYAGQSSTDSACPACPCIG